MGDTALPIDAARTWLVSHGVEVPDAHAHPDDDHRAGPRLSVAVDRDDEEQAREIVLRKLAVQARTRAELERALQRRAVPVEVQASVLDRMSEAGLVDDAAFARDWVASRQQRKHLSRSALRRELQGKGVDPDQIDEALGGVDQTDEYEAASDLARRRARTTGGLPYEVRRRRLAGVLGRRGFGTGVTARVLDEVLGEAADTG